MHPPPRSSPTEERSHECIYIYIYPRSMVVKPSVKHPHYSECSVCPPIYIHVPPPHHTKTPPPPPPPPPHTPPPQTPPFPPPAIKCSPQPSRTFPHAPPSPPPLTPQPGGTCLCLSANWRV